MRHFALLALLSIGACTHQRQATFQPSEMEWSTKQGTGTITGSAFLRTRGGDVMLAAGKDVILNPWSGYTAEWYQRHVIEGKNIGQPDERAARYQRRTVADSEGKFKFEGIPAGEYVVASHVTWLVNNGTIIASETGGWAHARVKVEDGKSVNVMATR